MRGTRETKELGHCTSGSVVFRAAATAFAQTGLTAATVQTLGGLLENAEGYLALYEKTAHTLGCVAENAAVYAAAIEAITTAYATWQATLNASPLNITGLGGFPTPRVLAQFNLTPLTGIPNAAQAIFYLANILLEQYGKVAMNSVSRIKEVSEAFTLAFTDLKASVVMNPPNEIAASAVVHYIGREFGIKHTVPLLTPQ